MPDARGNKPPLVEPATLPPTFSSPLERPIYLTLEHDEVKVYYDLANVTTLAAWQNRLIELVKGCGVACEEEAWSGSNHEELNSERQVLSLKLVREKPDDDSDELYHPLLSPGQLKILRAELNVCCTTSGFAEYAYGEAFGRRNGLSVLFTTEEPHTGDFKSVIGTWGNWQDETDSRVFGVFLHPKTTRSNMRSTPQMPSASS